MLLSLALWASNIIVEGWGASLLVPALRGKAPPRAIRGRGVVRSRGADAIGVGVGAAVETAGGWGAPFLEPAKREKAPTRAKCGRGVVSSGGADVIEVGDGAAVATGRAVRTVREERLGSDSGRALNSTSFCSTMRPLLTCDLYVVELEFMLSFAESGKTPFLRRL